VFQSNKKCIRQAKSTDAKFHNRFFSKIFQHSAVYSFLPPQNNLMGKNSPWRSAGGRGAADIIPQQQI
jgi:hypothetical protein